MNFKFYTFIPRTQTARNIALIPGLSLSLSLFPLKLYDMKHPYTRSIIHLCPVTSNFINAILFLHA
jgi:hypothetical protein